MLRSRYLLAMVVIVLLAAFLRFYHLAEVPHGMTWDEAAIGYNAYAIWTARRDEWLVKLPLSFRSFGDYKAPLAIYALSPLVGLIDLNLLVLRTPFAIAGVLAVVGMMFLTDLLLLMQEKKSPQLTPENRTLFSLSAGFILATSPWHLHYSRVGFESGLALTFIIWGSYFFFKWLHGQSTDDQQTLKHQTYKPFLYLFSSALLFGAAMYAYHSAKIVVPALILVLVGMWWRQTKKYWKQTLSFLAAFSVSIVPLLSDAITGQGSERFNQASVLASGASANDTISIVWQNFISHFDPAFLLFGYTPTLRHGDGSWGVLLATTYFLALVGLLAGYITLTQYLKGKTFFALLRVPLLATVWIILGILPAAVGIDVPHSNRALLALPGFVLLAVWGMSWLNDFLSGSHLKGFAAGTHGEKNTVLKLFLGCTLLLHSLLLIKQQQHYYTVFAAESAEEFKDGYVEAFEYAVMYEKGTPDIEPVDQIIFTSEYGQAYIYALFVRKTNPIYYQGGSLVKYLFLDTISASDLERSNTLIVASGTNDLLPTAEADHLVYGSDGQVRFKLYVTR